MPDVLRVKTSLASYAEVAKNPFISSRSLLENLGKEMNNVFLTMLLIGSSRWKSRAQIKRRAGADGEKACRGRTRQSS